MKKNITIVGVGRRCTGTSKVGRPYDFTEVSFTYDDENTVGLKAHTTCIDQDMLDDFGAIVLEPGMTGTCIFHFYNGKVIIDAFI